MSESETKWAEVWLAGFSLLLLLLAIEVLFQIDLSLLVSFALLLIVMGGCLPLAHRRRD